MITVLQSLADRRSAHTPSSVTTGASGGNSGPFALTRAAPGDVAPPIRCIGAGACDAASGF